MSSYAGCTFLVVDSCHKTIDTGNSLWMSFGLGKNDPFRQLAHYRVVGDAYA